MLDEFLERYHFGLLEVTDTEVERQLAEAERQLVSKRKANGDVGF